eukprot:GHVP01041769.1.p1 GENE.GHVP01041769.1~~GHVP01041769.1.p1  ORF type:complete len:693 (+),score=95.27 GHVP01041769.1:35-2080(+)
MKLGFALATLLHRTSALKRDERDFFTWREVSRIDISPSLFADHNPPIAACLPTIRKAPEMEAPHLFPPAEGTVDPALSIPEMPPPREEGFIEILDKNSVLSIDELASLLFDEVAKAGILNHLQNLFDKNSKQEEKTRSDRIRNIEFKIADLKNQKDGNFGQVNRILNAAEEEIPTIDPPHLHPDMRDFTYIETLVETLSTVRSFYTTMDCLIDFAKYEWDFPSIIEPEFQWQIQAKTDTSIGQCMCESLRYGVVFDDKHWGICRWMDVFQKTLFCGETRTLADACQVTAKTLGPCRGVDGLEPETDAQLYLTPFENVAVDGLIPRYIYPDISTIDENELVTFHYLFRALALHNEFSLNFLCGQQDPREPELVPGWKIIKHVNLEEIHDPLVTQTQTKVIPFATVSHRQCDLLIVLRTGETDYEGRVFMTYNHHSPNITDSEFGGYHSGFYNVATDIMAAIEDEVQDQQECVASSESETSPRIILAGHGLGAGVAQPLSQMLVNLVVDIKPDVSAVLFSAPAAMESRHIDDFNSAVNVRSIRSDKDAAARLPCRQIDSAMGHPLCSGLSMVPVYQEDGRMVYYGEVNGRIEFTAEELHEMRQDDQQDNRWIDLNLMDLKISSENSYIRAFNSNQFQHKAFHHCSYGCWTSTKAQDTSVCTLVSTQDDVCTYCDRFVDRSLGL